VGSRWFLGGAPGHPSGGNLAVGLQKLGEADEAEKEQGDAKELAEMRVDPFGTVCVFGEGEF
jgi:hypothetical protein